MLLVEGDGAKGRGSANRARIEIPSRIVGDEEKVRDERLVADWESLCHFTEWRSFSTPFLA